MKVFRGRLVHSLKPEKIEILEDAVIGYSEIDGKVYIPYSGFFSRGKIFVVFVVEKQTTKYLPTEVN